jgi:hypothetical protein
MTEAQWQACEDPTQLLEFLAGRACKRTCRLFVCACCRRLERLVAEQAPALRAEFRRAILVGEQLACGAVEAEQRVLAAELEKSAFGNLAKRLTDPWPLTHVSAAIEARVARKRKIMRAYDSFRFDHSSSQAALTAGAAEKRAQAELVRDIWNPFALNEPDPAWFTDTVRTLAQLIDTECSFGGLPVLADALEEAGCSDVRVLAHLREGLDGAPAAHVKGCWVLELLRERW